MDDTCDVAIIGAGAAGLAAAIFAAEAAPRRVILLDGAAKVGAKILRNVLSAQEHMGEGKYPCQRIVNLMGDPTCEIW